MKFIKHENFPDAFANLIRHYEYQRGGQTSLTFPQEEYGNDVRPEDWFACVAKHAKEHRPFILSMDDGIRGNLLTIRKMRESGCSFVYLMKNWAGLPFDAFSWQIIRAWPEVLRVAGAAHAVGRQCRIDVTLKGRAHVTNL